MFNEKIEIDKVYNCDCMDLMQAMIEQGIKADCIITDPPYNINFKPQRQNSGNLSSRKPIQNDNIEKNQFIKWLNNIMKFCFNSLKDDSFLISFMSWSTIPEYNFAIQKAGFKIKSMLIWEKECFGIGYYTRPQYEPMYLCIKGNPKPPKIAISDIIKCNREKNIEHSCQKPTNLINKLLNTFTKESDLILDPFMGSFTTAVACHKMQRHFIGAELDKEYFDLGSKRLADVQNQISMFDL